MISMLKDFLLRRFAKSKAVSSAPSPLMSYVTGDHLTPSESLFRMGTAYGGWHIPKHHRLGPESVCYLVGAGEDISFDCVLAKTTGAQIRIFDPTPRAIAHFEALTKAAQARHLFPVNNSAVDFYDVDEKLLQKMSFHPFGLADVDAELKFFMPRNPRHVSCSLANLQKTEEYFIAQCYRLNTLMRMLGDKQVDFLKIDIEGAEYSVIDDLIRSNALPRLFLIEFDETYSVEQAAIDKIRHAIRELERAGMKCISVENSNAVFERGDNYPC